MGEMKLGLVPNLSKAEARELTERYPHLLEIKYYRKFCQALYSCYELFHEEETFYGGKSPITTNEMHFLRIKEDAKYICELMDFPSFLLLNQPVKYMLMDVEHIEMDMHIQVNYREEAKL